VSRLDSPARVRTLGRLQRHLGNAAVARQLASSRGGAPRSAPAQTARRLVTATPPATATLQRQPAGVGQKAKKHTVRFPAKEGKVNWAIGKLPIKVSKVVVSGQAIVEEEVADSAAASPTQARSGGVASPGRAGLRHEVDQKWAEWQDTALGSVSVNSKATGELTTKGGEVGLELLGLKFDPATVTLRFRLIRYDKDKTDLELATTSLLVRVAAVTGKGAFQGTPYKYELQPTFEFILAVDKTRVAAWLAEQFAKTAAAELAIALGFVAIGVSTIAAGIVTASLGGEIRERVEKAIKFTNQYCAAYEAALQGRPSEAVFSIWGAKGFQTAQVAVEATKVPKDVFFAEAKKRNLRGEAFAAGWPLVKAAMLDDYRADHDIEWAVYGERGPGYKVLKQILDSERHLNF
jgi:hypothetical protein